MEEKQDKLYNKIFITISLSLILSGFYFISLYNYLLFHSLAELFSIVIAFTIFILAWNSRHTIDNQYLVFLGIAYLFIGFIDTLHTLAYTGMGVFPGYDSNLPTQLWIVARYMESLSILIACFVLNKKKLNINFVISGYTIITSLLLLFIFYWEIFPACYVEGVGLTPFKRISEYLISFMLVVAILFLLKSKKDFNPRVFQYIIISIILTIAGELAFTFYISVYGFSNLIGHIFKILSFYYIYLAIIVTGLKEPIKILFRDLQESREKLLTLTRTDPLTGCYNRRYTLELFNRQAKLSQRTHSSVLLAYVDIDHFKCINDDFGHNEGDKALKRIAGLFKAALREIDIVCRPGGDEFLLIFPDSSLNKAPQIKARLYRKLKILNENLGLPYQMGFSIGFSEYQYNHPQTLDELTYLADQEMYKEKRRKRMKKIPNKRVGE